MRYESKRRPRGGKGGRKGDEQIKRYFFLSSCEFVKESKNDFLSSRRVCDSPAMNSDELCAVMNPRHEKHFREHEHYSACSCSFFSSSIFILVLARNTAAAILRKIFPGDQEHLARSETFRGQASQSGV